MAGTVQRQVSREEVRDLYDLPAQHIRLFELLPKQLSAAHVDLLREWDLRMQTRGANGGRPTGLAARLKHLRSARNLLRWMDEREMGDFRCLGKEGVEALYREVLNRVSNGDTRKAHLLALKLLYRHVKGLKEDPEETKWIRVDAFVTKERLPESILTEDEFRRLVDGAGHPMYQAAFAVLGEVGHRSSEILNIRRRHVLVDDYGVVFFLHGKGNKMRRVRGVECAGHVVRWLESHPDKSPNAFVFINIGNVNRGAPLEYASLRAALMRTAERLGIDPKKARGHTMRAFAASRASLRIRDPALRAQFGWSATSRTPARYLRLSGENIDAAVLEGAGVIVKKAPPVILCPKCKFTADGKTMRYCPRCSAPLTLEVALEQEEETRDLTDFAAEVGKRILELAQDDLKIQAILREADAAVRGRKGAL